MTKCNGTQLATLFIFLTFPSFLIAQYVGQGPYWPEKGGLIINEISNGTTGSKEYVELVVIGSPQDPAAAVDLQDWIIDDNNYAGAGEGNATGYLIFGSCYSAVPPGSILVIYNADDPNPELPPDDPYDTAPADGVYIIPHVHSCMDACSSNPSPQDATYCPCSDPLADPIIWQLGLRNSGDMVQIRDRCETLVHAIKWGSISLAPEVAGAPVLLSYNDAQGGKLIGFSHQVDNNWLDGANFLNLNSAGNETPGSPNNVANQNFISLIAQGNLPLAGTIMDCMDADAGDLMPPIGQEPIDLPLEICLGEDLPAFSTDYSLSDEFAPDAEGFTFEYAYLLCENEAPDYPILQYSLSGDLDFSVLPEGSYLVWGLSYIQTNGTLNILDFLDVYHSIGEIEAYTACGYDSDLDNRAINGEPMEIIVIDSQVSLVPTSLSRCTEGADEALFELNTLDSTLTSGAGGNLEWYLDEAMTMPIDDPENFFSGSRTVFATVANELCPQLPVPVELLVTTGPEVALGIVEEIHCPGDSTGSISLSIEGGTAPYHISWDNNVVFPQNGEDLPSGVYAVTVTDELGCIGIASVILEEPEGLTLECSQEAPVSSIGGTDGIGGLHLSGGTAPYSVQVTGPGFSTVFNSSSESISIPDLPGGDFQITVSDANGCTQSCDFTIGYPDCPFLLEMQSYEENCPGSMDGEVSLALYGGVGPYQFAWSNGETSQGLRDLAPGIYAVTVTDQIGCVASGSIEVKAAAPIELFADAIAPPCFDSSDGVISVIDVWGGAGAYALSFNNGSFENVEELPLQFEGLNPGNYQIKVKDGNDCEADFSFELAESQPLELELGSGLTIAWGDTISMRPSTNFMVDSFTWTPGGRFPADQWNPQIRLLETTTFNLEAFDASGCSVSDQVTIFVESRQDQVYLPNAFSPNYDGSNDYFTAFGGQEVELIKTLQVFDRWGNHLFKADEISPNAEPQGWDGTFRGREMPAGVYVYLVEIRFADGREELFKGDLTLLR